MSIELKKCALRQSKDGTIISFVLHPNDALTEDGRKLSNAEIGAVFEFGVTQVDYDNPESTAP